MVLSDNRKKFRKSSLQGVPWPEASIKAIHFDQNEKSLILTCLVYKEDLYKFDGVSLFEASYLAFNQDEWTLFEDQLERLQVTIQGDHKVAKLISATGKVVLTIHFQNSYEYY